MKPIKTLSEIPSAEHLAALVFKTQTIYHEGDERSRTNPGHGYPAYSETTTSIEYIPFKNKEEAESWVIENERRTYDKKVYRIIKSNPVTVKTSLDVSFQ
jgi:hypothetical protein